MLVSKLRLKPSQLPATALVSPNSTLMALLTLVPGEGELSTGLTLGIPLLYNVLTDVYRLLGRPQNDGPAERAITLIKFADSWIGQGNNATYISGTVNTGM
jgi:hypothetical protein